jgi:hypothetical protein
MKIYIVVVEFQSCVYKSGFCQNKLTLVIYLLDRGIHKSSNGISCRIPRSLTLFNAFICHWVCSFNLPVSFWLQLDQPSHTQTLEVIVKLFQFATIKLHWYFILAFGKITNFELVQ